MAAAKGAWTPNWQFDAICLDSRAAEGIADRFAVDLRRVAWRGLPPGDVFQIVVPSLGHAWFDPEALREAARAQHGGDGAQCADCGVWRWMPLEVGLLPALRVDPPLGEVDIAASPEWFGDGWNAFRQILMRRALAASIVAAGPQDFEVHEVG